jgi:Clostridial hydrophobic W
MSEAASAERPHVAAKQVVRRAARPPEASNRVAELQVSAHLMTLDTGLFCVFQTPGSPQSDPATGLPGVRITPAPGLAGRPEAVSVSTFREDGWLNGTAALVRVSDGSAQILVTIYQNKGRDAAPRLQVLRLSGEPNAASTPEPVAAPQLSGNPPAAETTPSLANPEVMAHVHRMGDVGCTRGEWLGQKGSGQWVEGFGLAPLKGLAPEDLEYQAVLGRNWLSPWVESGKFCGSRGMALPLLGLKVRLKGAAAKNFECSYSATFVDGTAVGPVAGGDPCEAASLAALEAFQVVIHPRGSKAVTPKAAPAAKPHAGKKSAAEKTAIAKTNAAKTDRMGAKLRARM